MRAAWLPAVLFTSVTLTGCASGGWTEDLGNAAASAAGSAAEQALQDATGGDVSVNLGNGASVPSDWPDSVPVPDLELAAASVTGSGWTAVAPAPALAFDDYVDELEHAGFSSIGDISMEDAAKTDRLDDGSHEVTVAWAKEPGGDSGLLTVTVAGAA
ncbi:hypothetical protein [Demequina globuliformis]|uniref:hypothetical protein n=1 Tax=Demequina globuliformis TaxID=676202 RepID=UPI0007810023|nr:hypothetical protein [Demequina globuliformis]